MTRKRPIDELSAIIWSSVSYDVCYTTYYGDNDDIGDRGYALIRREDGIVQARMPAFAQVAQMAHEFDGIEESAKAITAALTSIETTDGLIEILARDGEVH